MVRRQPAELLGVLDRDDPLGPVDRIDDALAERGLADPGRAGKEDVQVCLYRDAQKSFEIARGIGGHRPVEVAHGPLAAPLGPALGAVALVDLAQRDDGVLVLAQGQRDCAVRHRRRQTDTEPLAIGQLLVEERALRADILLPQRAGEDRDRTPDHRNRVRLDASPRPRAGRPRPRPAG